MGTYPDCTDPPPTPYAAASAAIAAADTAEAAQAAYDEVKDDVTAAQGEALQDAVDKRTTALATKARAETQKDALTTAAGAVDTSDLSTQEAVNAARAAIVALREALNAADDVSDDDKTMYTSKMTDAVAEVDKAQGGIDTATRRKNQTAALTSASGALQAALAAFSGKTPTQAQLDAAKTARTALNDAITDAADLIDTEKNLYQREAKNAATPITTAQTAFDNAKGEATKNKNAAMAAKAAKLYVGIGDKPFPGRVAKYDGADIKLIIGDDFEFTLTEDKKATVADNQGWEGKRYTRTVPASDGTYAAVVYSNVGESTEGKKFSTQHTLADGVLELIKNGEAGADFAAERVGGSNFDQAAGVKQFKLPDPNTDGATKVTTSGTYHGVSGTYTCTPAAGNACGIRKANKGFDLGTVTANNDFTNSGGLWTFKPTDPATKVMSTPDDAYASYGWWLHTAADGKLMASAFADNKGTAPTVPNIIILRGTATYMGGAAGKYALRSSTGGTNDAGDFTADVELNATFADDHTISGTINNFMDADNEKRDWSVELKTSAISDAGAITNTPADSEAGNQMTVWTIDDKAASASGEWSGNLQEVGDDGVPSVATGTFHSMYGADGSMVGAFGANKQNKQ